jgi:hypothetical protein
MEVRTFTYIRADTFICYGMDHIHCDNRYTVIQEWQRYESIIAPPQSTITTWELLKRIYGDVTHDVERLALNVINAFFTREKWSEWSDTSRFGVIVPQQLVALSCARQYTSLTVLDALINVGGVYDVPLVEALISYGHHDILSAISSHKSFQPLLPSLPNAIDLLQVLGTMVTSQQWARATIQVSIIHHIVCSYSFDVRDVVQGCDSFRC